MKSMESSNVCAKDSRSVRNHRGSSSLFSFGAEQDLRAPPPADTSMFFLALLACFPHEIPNIFYTIVLSNRVRRSRQLSLVNLSTEKTIVGRVAARNLTVSDKKNFLFAIAFSFLRLNVEDARNVCNTALHSFTALERLFFSLFSFFRSKDFFNLFFFLDRKIFFQLVAFRSLKICILVFRDLIL